MIYIIFPFLILRNTSQMYAYVKGSKMGAAVSSWIFAYSKKQQEGNGPINLRRQGQWKFLFASYVDPNYLHIQVHIAYMMGPFDSLWGHYSRHAASEVKSDLKFQIS